MNTYSNKNDVLYKYIKILGNCYINGSFEELFPFLADTCVFETQWISNPYVGKREVMSYFTQKGQLIVSTEIEYMIVKFVGNVNLIDNSIIHLNNAETKRGAVGLLYPNEKFAMYMRQKIGLNENEVIIDLQLNQDNLISRIDICDPDLFKFECYEGPFKKCDIGGNLNENYSKWNKV